MYESADVILVFFFGAISVTTIVQVVTLMRIEKSVYELRGAIERLIIVDASRKV